MSHLVPRTLGCGHRPGIGHHNDGVVLGRQRLVAQLADDRSDAFRPAEQHVGQVRTVTAHVDQCSRAVALRVEHPVTRFGRALGLGAPVTGMTGDLPDPAKLRTCGQHERGLYLGSPGHGPVDHHPRPRLPGRGEHSFGSGQVGGHRLFDHHVQPARRGPGSQSRPPGVVGKDAHDVRPFALDQLFIVGIRRRGARFASPRKQRLVRLGNAHQPRVAQAGETLQIGPDVFVCQAQHPDAETFGHRRLLKQRICGMNHRTPKRSSSGRW